MIKRIEVKRHEAIANIWSTFAIKVGAVFVAICVIIGIVLREMR